MPPVSRPLPLANEAPQPVGAAPPFVVEMVSAQLRVSETLLAFDLELAITNTQTHVAEGVRPAAALISAHPGQDLDIAAFHGDSAGIAQAQAFDVPAGGTVRLPVQVNLPRERLHVVTVHGRPIMVALLMLDLRWRAGLSIRRFGEDFLVGGAGSGARPGPIWLDRAPPRALAAIAYAPVTR